MSEQIEVLESAQEAPSDVVVDTANDNGVEVEESRKNLVSEWVDKIKKADAYWRDKNVWQQIKENQYLAKYGAPKDWYESGKYVVPILARHINQQVATLYAKNPTVVAKRRKRVMYKAWDGRQDTLQAAMEGAVIGDPASAEIVQEVLAVRQENLMFDRMAKTLEVLWDYTVGEQAVNFKQQLKAAVRRAKICKVAYVKLGFQRILEKNPEVTAEIEDITAKIKSIEETVYRISEDDIDGDSAELEQLRLNLEDLQSQETLVVREGITFDFPKANEILIDPACRHLRSFAGAGFVAHKFDMDPKKVYEVYGVDLKTAYTKYNESGSPYKDGDKGCMARVYEVQDKRNQQCFVVCEGYPDFLREPGRKLNIERFWTLFPLVFNECEDDDNIYPPSDVELGKHIQMEYNRSREALRQHRRAARPYYVATSNVEEADRDKLANHADHEVITVAALDVGQKVDELIQRGPVAPIDPNLYEVEMHFSDLLRSLGTAESSLGGTSDSTATEASIAEQSQGTNQSSAVDDLDELLADLAKAASQVMFAEFDKDTVLEIVGPGAVWPDMPVTREALVKDLWLDIEAGSSGRPNQAAELAKVERATPLLIQIPGINPEPLARKIGNLLDIDLDELIADGVPSIQALNAAMAKAGANPGGNATGNAETDPNQQGAEGANNVPGPGQNENEPGPQPAYPDTMAIA